MHSPHESRAATQSLIHAACGHRGNELPDRAAAAEVFAASSTIQPKAFVQASFRSFPDWEQRLPRALFHGEATTKSRSQRSYATGSHYLFYRLTPLRSISGEGR